jgi:hypothetical protein
MAYFKRQQQTMNCAIYTRISADTQTEKEFFLRIPREKDKNFSLRARITGRFLGFILISANRQAGTVA